MNQMPPFETIALLVAAYIAVVILLLSLNILSRWRAWVKAGAILISGALFVFSFVGMYQLLGQPTNQQVPDRFNLIASRIVEPNKLMDEPGSVFLWIELLDQNNIPSGIPLNYRLKFTPDLAEAVNKAQDLIDQGGAIEASLREASGFRNETADVQLDQSPEAGGGAGEGGIDAQQVEALMLVFNNMPAVRLPDKGPL